MALSLVFLFITGLSVFCLLALHLDERIAARQKEQFTELSTRADEHMALQKKLLSQGEETIALLNAIKDYHEHHSTKN